MDVGQYQIAAGAGWPLGRRPGRRRRRGDGPVSLQIALLMTVVEEGS
jgi:hypothetical protein